MEIVDSFNGISFCFPSPHDWFPKPNCIMLLGNGFRRLHRLHSAASWAYTHKIDLNSFSTYNNYAVRTIWNLLCSTVPAFFLLCLLRARIFVLIWRLVLVDTRKIAILWKSSDFSPHSCSTSPQFCAAWSIELFKSISKILRRFFIFASFWCGGKLVHFTKTFQSRQSLTMLVFADNSSHTKCSFPMNSLQ